MTRNKAAKTRGAAVFSGKVTPDWIERGVFLSNAALQLGDPMFTVPARAAAERFAELRDGETPEMFEETSKLSGEARDKELLHRLYGDQKQAWLDYYINRNAAERLLKFNLGWEGTLRAFGRNKTPNKEPEWIPVQAWFYLRRDPATIGDVVSGEGMKYYYVCVVDPRLYLDHPSSAPIENAAGANRSKDVRKKLRGISHHEPDMPLVVEEMHRLLTAEPPQARAHTTRLSRSVGRRLE